MIQQAPTAIKRTKRFTHLVLIVCFFVTIDLSFSTEHRLQAAQFNSKNELIRPGNLDEWIFLGTSVGHGYSEQKVKRFSIDEPGFLQLVQMEPTAYEYFKENGTYANGSMLSLSFYHVQKRPEPLVEGLVQGELASFEIHLIDKEQFKDGRAFYLFKNQQQTIPALAIGNDCVSCHNKHGDFDGTFSQFYPVINDATSRHK